MQTQHSQLWQTSWTWSLVVWPASFWLSTVNSIGVWVNSGSWWWTGRPGMLQFMGSQGVGHDWATELNWLNFSSRVCLFPFSRGQFSETWQFMDFWWLSVKRIPSANGGDAGLIPSLGRSPGKEIAVYFQYFCLGNPMDWGAWGAAVQGVTEVGHLVTK